jgi:hypothetical protein
MWSTGTSTRGCTCRGSWACPSTHSSAPRSSYLTRCTSCACCSAARTRWCTASTAPGASSSPAAHLPARVMGPASSRCRIRQPHCRCPPPTRGPRCTAWQQRRHLQQQCRNTSTRSSKAAAATAAAAAAAARARRYRHCCTARSAAAPLPAPAPTLPASPGLPEAAPRWRGRRAPKLAGTAGRQLPQPQRQCRQPPPGQRHLERRQPKRPSRHWQPASQQH